MTDLEAVATDHPARWSQGVLGAMAVLVADEAERKDRVLRVLDPFCGVGRHRLATALAGGRLEHEVTGVELQPTWAGSDAGTVQGDATDLPAEWSGLFDAVCTSPAFANRMADHHDAADSCKTCAGVGRVQLSKCDHGPGCAVLHTAMCPTCKGHGLSWRNTYAHALRRGGADLVAGSGAGLQWGAEYRRVHAEATMEMLRVTTPGGLLLVNMSNHIRGGQEQPVVEWWVMELLDRGCSIVEVRRVATPRQRNGANGEARVDGEVVIAVRTPDERRLL